MEVVPGAKVYLNLRYLTPEVDYVAFKLPNQFLVRYWIQSAYGKLAASGLTIALVSPFTKRPLMVDNWFVHIAGLQMEPPVFSETDVLLTSSQALDMVYGPGTQ